MTIINPISKSQSLVHSTAVAKLFWRRDRHRQLCAFLKYQFRNQLTTPLPLSPHLRPPPSSHESPVLNPRLFPNVSVRFSSRVQRYIHYKNNNYVTDYPITAENIIFYLVILLSLVLYQQKICFITCIFFSTSFCLKHTTSLTVKTTKSV